MAVSIAILATYARSQGCLAETNSLHHLRAFVLPLALAYFRTEARLFIIAICGRPALPGEIADIIMIMLKVPWSPLCLASEPGKIGAVAPL